MAIFIMLVAATLAALSNLCMRKSIDAGGTARAYLAVQQTLAIGVTTLLNPIRLNDYTWNSTTAYIGLSGGLILGTMMWVLGKALEKGPPGLTIAILSSSSVMPAIVMVSLFGSNFGFHYTFANGMGSFLVVLGLFWASWKTYHQAEGRQWVLFSSAAFILHMVFLSFMNWRSLLIRPDLISSPLLPTKFIGHDSTWFIPMIYVTSAIIQISVYAKNETRLPKRVEGLYGFSGAIFHGSCTFMMIKATEIATPLENAMIFPIFCVAIILLCNLWGQTIYNERVNWLANALCLTGLVIGTFQWSALQQSDPLLLSENASQETVTTSHDSDKVSNR